MNVKRLRNFLTGDLDPKEFASAIHDEVQDHVENISKLGASAPIYIYGDASLNIKHAHIGRMCDAYAHEILTTQQVEYIADLMYEGFRVDDEQVEALLFELSDEDLNAPLTPRCILEVKKQIG